MQSILPTTMTAPTRVDPRIALFYSIPKTGKTTEMAKLEGNLILDTEFGTELVSALKIPITSISGDTTYDGAVLTGTSIDAVYDQIVKDAIAWSNANGGKKPKPPYKFITIDTIDKLEEMCEVTATVKYKQSVIGKSFTGNSVIELPNGAGYYHLRNEVLLYIDRIASICEHLILISHIREKNINKGGIDVAVADISLTGRLGAMVAAKCDVIGYMYREPKKPLMISFESQDNSVMGARVPRLAGKRMPFDWHQIFSGSDVKVIGEELSSTTAQP